MMWYIYKMEYYSVIKKNDILPFVVMWMDLKIIILSEVSQTEKQKYHMTSLTCGILKETIQLNLLSKQEQTHRPSKL